MVIFNSYVKLPEGIPFISHSYPIHIPLCHTERNHAGCIENYPIFCEREPTFLRFSIFGKFLQRDVQTIYSDCFSILGLSILKKLKSVLVIHVVIPVLYAKVAFLGYDFWTTRLFPIVTYMLGPNQTKIAVWFSIEKGLDAPCCREYIDCNPKKRIERSSGWWLSPTPLKNDEVRQLGWWNSPIVGEK